MSLETLVICSDPQLIRVLRSVLKDLGISVCVAEEPDEARQHVATRRFDGVLIDCELPGATDLFETIHKQPAYKKSLRIALASHDTTVSAAFELGAQFVMYKPLNMERATRILRAAQALMNRERRRSLRLPIETHVHVRFGRGKDAKATMFDLGIGGIGIKLHDVIPATGIVQVSFTLPNTKTKIEASGEIAWADDKGRLGIQFLQVPEDAQLQLDKWVSNQRQPDEPAAKAEPRQLRGAIDLPLTVSVVRSGSTKMVRGHCNDLNEHGLGGTMGGEIFPGEVVNIEFSLPSGDQIKVRAYVRHNHGSRCGFEFLTMADAHRQAIRRFCEQLPAK